MSKTGIRLRLAEPNDSANVLALIRRCYGDTYWVPRPFDLQALRAAIEHGDLVYALACDQGDPEGHIGQIALKRTSQTGLYEHCRAVVDERYRGRGLMARMSEFLFERSRQAEPRFVVGHSVTCHLRTQRYNSSAGFTALGLLLGVFPGHPVAGISHCPRVASAVLVGLSFEEQPAPRSLAIVGRDRERALRVLHSLGYPVEREARARRSAPLQCVIEPRSNGIVAYRYTAAGGAPPTAGFAEREAEAGTRCLWAEVPVGHPDAPYVLEALRTDGFGFAAYIPLGGARGEDVLRMQRHFDSEWLDPDGILVVPSSEDLKHDVLEDCGLNLAGALA